jgi:acyl phosphate:glycerol-3-phosphate acyltransferase
VIILGIVALISYLLGSIPAGYFAGRLAGTDIRKHGSGNIGATNVTRVLGKRYGYPVFLFDFLKGLGAVRLSILIGRNDTGDLDFLQLVELVAAVSCVLGHSFPVWLGFRGGKGVATSAGALFGMMPFTALVVIAVWITTFQVTRYVSVASMVAAVSVPITVAIMAQFKKTDDRVFLYFCVVMAAGIVVRHRSNLIRLMRGTEPRFRKKGEDQ